MGSRPIEYAFNLAIKKKKPSFCPDFIFQLGLLVMYFWC